MNIPKTWAQALGRPFEEIVNTRLIFKVKDGKASIELEGEH